MFFKVKLLTPS